MYYAWPVKTHTSNKFRLSQILKKSSVASSKIAEGNKVGKKKSKNRSRCFICLKKSLGIPDINATDISKVKYRQFISRFHIRKFLSHAKIMKIFLHLNNESGQWQHLKIKNIFSARQLLIKAEITLVFGSTFILMYKHNIRVWFYSYLGL